MGYSADNTDTSSSAGYYGTDRSATGALCFAAREIGPDIYWMVRLGGSQNGWVPEAIWTEVILLLLGRTLIPDTKYRWFSAGVAQSTAVPSASGKGAARS